MRRPIIVSALLLTLLATRLSAQNFTGTCLVQAPRAGAVTLTLRRDSGGNGGQVGHTVLPVSVS